MSTSAKTKKQLAISQTRLERSEAQADRIVALLEELRVGPEYLERVLVSVNSHFLFLKTEEIDWVQAEGNYVRLHTNQKSFLLRRAIGQLAASLDPRRYRRVHRSTIVNLDRVRELHPQSHGELLIVMQDGTELTWSRGYKNHLKRF